MRTLAWRALAGLVWVGVLEDTRGSILELDLSDAVQFDQVNSQPYRPRVGQDRSTTAVAISERTWLGLLHGMPIQFSRPSSALEQDLPLLLDWLVHDRAPVWSSTLAEDERWWPANERGTLTSKYRRYNMLREALASTDSAVARTARSLRRWLVQVRRQTRPR